jgi:hypoxanthine phosphoribosyltransferase
MLGLFMSTGRLLPPHFYPVSQTIPRYRNLQNIGRPLKAICSQLLIQSLFPMQTKTHMKVLISRMQIADGVARIGQEITRDFAGQSVILVGVLKGACLFLSDLARQIELDATFDFIAVRSYGTQKESAGEVQLIKDVTTPLEDKNVILVEDILDTGLTFNFLRKLLIARKPRTLKFAALLDKPSRRQMPVQADYVGFKIPDEFVVGYGLDYAERFRNLPDICVFSEDQ